MLPKKLEKSYEKNRPFYTDGFYLLPQTQERLQEANDWIRRQDHDQNFFGNFRNFPFFG